MRALGGHVVVGGSQGLDHHHLAKLLWLIDREVRQWLIHDQIRQRDGLHLGVVKPVGSISLVWAGHTVGKTSSVKQTRLGTVALHGGQDYPFQDVL
jgi:hypothetical protein